MHAAWLLCDPPELLYTAFMHIFHALMSAAAGPTGDKLLSVPLCDPHLPRTHIGASREAAAKQVIAKVVESATDAANAPQQDFLDLLKQQYLEATVPVETKVAAEQQREKLRAQQKAAAAAKKGKKGKKQDADEDEEEEDDDNDPDADPFAHWEPVGEPMTRVSTGMQPSAHLCTLGPLPPTTTLHSTQPGHRAPAKLRQSLTAHHSTPQQSPALLNSTEQH